MPPAYSHRSRRRVSGSPGNTPSSTADVSSPGGGHRDPAKTVSAAPRRAHTKSKSGCRTCKRRKIKCDEHHPSCRNCIRHHVSCDFLEDQPPPAAPVPASPSASLGHGHTLGGSPGGLNMVDLELLYNFTNFTHSTLSGDSSVRHFFRTTAIRMALNCDYLMRCILAVSALHLARFRRDKTDYYASVALIHHHYATQVAIPLMNNITPENCECLHLFAVLTLYFAFGYPKSEQDSMLLAESVIPNWLALIRGSEPSLSVIQPETYRGPLAPLFAYGRGRWRVLYGDSQKISHPWLLSELEDLVQRSCSDDPSLLSIYRGAIENLRGILSKLVVRADEAGRDEDTPLSGAISFRSALEPWDILVWKWDVAKDFLPLLQDPVPRQETVAIFAHFLIVIKRLENQWWLEGWATHVMERVWSMLDEEHRLWVQWPVEELGWVPP